MDSYANDGVSILILLTKTHYLLKRLIHSNQWKINAIRNIQCLFAQLRLFQSLESSIRSIYSSIGRVFTCLIPSIDSKNKWGTKKCQRSSLGTIILTVSSFLSNSSKAQWKKKSLILKAILFLNVLKLSNWSLSYLNRFLRTRSS